MKDAKLMQNQILSPRKAANWLVAAFYGDF